MRRRCLPLAFLILAGAPVFGAPALAADARAAQYAAIPIDDAVALILRDEARGDIKRFHAERGYRPLWVRSGRTVAAAQSLLGYNGSARLDGIKPASYDPSEERRGGTEGARTGRHGGSQ